MAAHPSLLLPLVMILAASCGSRSSLLFPRGDGALVDGPALPLDRPRPPASFASIPSGTFMMGSPSGEPCRAVGSNETQHTVTLTRGFYLQKTEVTQKEFRARRGYNPADFGACGESCPVELVSWSEAAAYCNALSSAEALPLCYSCEGAAAQVSCGEETSFAGKIHTCQGYRLPTEAEWEYAYRAGTTTALYNGKIADCTKDAGVDAIGWYQHNSGGRTHPGGQKLPNAWGLLDMAGNVWEWCNDRFEYDLGKAPVTDPQGPGSGLSRVLRGSSFFDPAGHLRAADRFAYAPGARNSNIGFRCARSD